ncbi:hypothetical protein BLNAU_17314 [Blattamonas nauphoetae]|uniref:Uncharacterized protein n=1 Tax=Blattamonas nauphoetae TaxID=2049346 RepID=A0ABQ9X7K3_9EUKA|nr:hypothetical protein BLNAU_17314 [Blattamonas nauphoetae]
MALPHLPTDGKLTPPAKSRLINLGSEIYKYYEDTLFPTDFDERIFYFRSTSVTRARHSLQYFQKGLFSRYAKKSKQTIEIPHHVVHFCDDILLYSVEASPTALSLSEQEAEEKRYKNVKKEYKHVVDHVERCTGTTLEGSDEFIIYDSVLVADEIGHTLPNGITKDHLPKIRRLKELLFLTKYPPTPLWCHAVGGRFWSQVFFDHFDSDIVAFSSKKPYPRYRHYSSHDTAVLPLLQALGVNLLTETGEVLYPQYGGFFVVEVYLDQHHTLDNPGVSVKYCLEPPVSGSIDLMELIPQGLRKEDMNVNTFKQRWADVHRKVKDRSFFTEVCGFDETNVDHLTSCEV